MKKFYLLLVLLSSLFGGLNAQSLSLGNQFITGDPLFFLEGHLTVTNVSNSNKDVVVQRVVNDTFPGHNSYFCWSQCYANFVNLSPDVETLPPGGSTTIFRSDVETNSIAGVTRITYCFFDQNNPSDSACVEFLYDTTVGLQDIPSSKNYLSKAYPNPASDYTKMFVNIVKGSRDARIKIFNMLGSQVKEIQVTDMRNFVKINLSDLRGGIYFYSLWVDGKSTGTNKLMISKN